MQPWNVRAEFEGPNTADFFNSINNPASPNASLMANPQIAVGPDEMLLVANSQIWRLPNGTAPGVIPNGLYPGSVLIGGQAYGAQRVSLDNWIGAAALAVLCPTGNTEPSAGVLDTINTRSAVSCQIDNATVTYDQMQGRFLVLFTVVDTGMTFQASTQSFAVTRPRKASWVLVVSKFAVLIDQACLQGTTTAAGCTIAGTPVSQGANAAGSFAFTTPTASVAANTSNVNTSVWSIIYGNDLTTLAPDNFGSRTSSGLSAAWNGDIGVGNINSIASLTGGAAGPATVNATYFNCNPNAIAPTPTTIPATTCYMPTGARIGVDNDTITIASPVINANVNGGSFSAVFNPPNGQIPGYAGTRVRVLKKTAIYTGTTLVPGNAYGATPAAGTYYDLFTGGGTPILPATVPTPGTPTWFTVVLNATGCVAGQQPNLANEDTTPPTCILTPIFIEPAHLRGRAQASFSGLMYPATAAHTTAQTYLVGTISSPVSQRTMFVAPVVETNPAPAVPVVNAFGPIPFFPVLNTFQPVALPNTFGNPGAVIQANFRSGEVPGATAAPFLLVGDSRPHNIIFREGYLYSARVVNMSPSLPAGGLATGQGSFTGGGPSLTTTVKYEVVQKFCANAGACVSVAGTSKTAAMTAGSTTLTVTGGSDAVAAIQVGMPAVSAGFLPASATVVSLTPAAAAATGNNTIVVSLAAIATGSASVQFGQAPNGTAALAYQQYWQNTNAWAPMFDMPANVVTYGVGTPYNALSFLEKLFVATTVPPLAGLPDAAYNTLPANTPTPLVGDFGYGDPRTRITYGSSGIAPTQLNTAVPCYSNQLSPGGSISGIANNPVAWASLWDTRCGVDATDTNPQIRDPYTGLMVNMGGVTAPTTVVIVFSGTTQVNDPNTTADETTIVNNGVIVTCTANGVLNAAPCTTVANGGPLFADIKAGDLITNVSVPNIPPGTTITAVQPGGVNQVPVTNQVVLSQAATAAGAITITVTRTVAGTVGSTYAAFTFRGGEAIDPNDGSLWNFGAYAMKRDASVSALAHWGTFAANYKLSFPTSDVYGNSTVLYNDIAGLPEQNFIQIAINQGLAPTLINGAGIQVAPPNATPIPFAGVNATVYPTIPAGVTAPGVRPAAGNFGPNDFVTRREMAYWIVKSTMDDTAINVYLANSTALNGVIGAGATAVSFADVPYTDPGWRYVEVMARKGYTSGCSAGVAARYCPDYVSTRRDLAAFMIRAKFGNVFGSVLSGCAFTFVSGTTQPTDSIFPPAMTTNCSAQGDNFGLFVSGLPYFTDNPAVTGNDWYPFIQKMRELRITNGTNLGPASDGRNGTYSIGVNGVPPLSGAGSEGNLTRRQVVTFMVRGFFL